MIYRNYSIYAEERVYNLLNVDNDGKVTTETIEYDYQEREYYFVIADENGSPIEWDAGDLDDCKEWIDRKIAREQELCTHPVMIATILTNEKVCEDCDLRVRA